MSHYRNRSTINRRSTTTVSTIDSTNVEETSTKGKQLSKHRKNSRRIRDKKVTPQLVDFYDENSDNEDTRLSREEAEGIKRLRLVRNKKFSEYHTTTRLVNGVLHFTDDNEKKVFENRYFKTKNRKKVSSVKKIYQGYIEFDVENTEQKKEFQIFRDQEIGFDLSWKNYLITTYADNDVTSDTDEINSGINTCIDQLGEAIKLMKKSTKKFFKEKQERHKKK